MPLAARITDNHICPKSSPPPASIPHVGGSILPSGKPSVFIGKLPAATEGNQCFCVGEPDKITKGSSSVIINGKQAARMGDPTQHQGKIVTGCTTVIIGD